MSLPRPKVPFLIIRGTQKVLCCLHGENIFAPTTQVWEISDVNTGCLSQATEGAFQVDDLDGNDVGTITITSQTVVS